MLHLAQDGNSLTWSSPTVKDQIAKRAHKNPVVPRSRLRRHCRLIERNEQLPSRHSGNSCTCRSPRSTSGSISGFTCRREAGLPRCVSEARTSTPEALGSHRKDPREHPSIAAADHGMTWVNSDLRRRYLPQRNPFESSRGKKFDSDISFTWRNDDMLTRNVG
jgi:hypothetical protein